MDRNQNALTDIILSDFSAGRHVMNALRAAPQMGTFLREIWDFDGAGGAHRVRPNMVRSCFMIRRPLASHIMCFMFRYRDGFDFHSYLSCLEDQKKKIDSLHGHMAVKMPSAARSVSGSHGCYRTANFNDFSAVVHWSWVGQFSERRKCGQLSSRLRPEETPLLRQALQDSALSPFAQSDHHVLVLAASIRNLQHLLYAFHEHGVRD